MSCTIVALPFMLLSLAVSAMLPVTVGVSNLAKEDDYTHDQDVEHLREVMKRSMEENHGNISEEDIKSICKEYTTAFMNSELLIKTLEEYGFDEFTTAEKLITGKVKDFTLEFYRTDSNEPYTMKISCDAKCDTTGIISDVNSEYALNAQEETYIKIKERLEKKNLKIDNEEILEDDSIMLTVNLD